MKVIIDSKKVKDRMFEMCLSAIDLGNKADLVTKTIYNILQGDNRTFTVKTAKKIAKALKFKNAKEISFPVVTE